jgi:hypothetical protein
MQGLGLYGAPAERRDALTMRAEQYQSSVYEPGWRKPSRPCPSIPPEISKAVGRQGRVAQRSSAESFDGFLVRDIAVADLPLTSLIAQNQAFIAWCAIALRLGRRRQGICLLPFLIGFVILPAHRRIDRTRALDGFD